MQLKYLLRSDTDAEVHPDTTWNTVNVGCFAWYMHSAFYRARDAAEFVVEARFILQNMQLHNLLFAFSLQLL